LQQAKLLLEASRFVNSFSTVTKINFCARKTGWVEESCQGINIFYLMITVDVSFIFHEPKTVELVSLKLLFQLGVLFLIIKEAVKKLKSVFFMH